MNRIILYSSEITERLTYIGNLMFEQLLGLTVEYTSSVDAFTASNAVQINYSGNSDLPGYNIQPSSLLFEQNIRPVDAKLGKSWLSVPTITLDQEAHFDILAASFYLVSRYEEYLPFEKDNHNRFTAENSILLKLNLLQRPVVNEWVLNVHKELLDLNASLLATPRKFEYLSTIDIDQAWKYKNKGFVRSLGGLVRDLVKLDWQSMRDRVSVLFSSSPDAFYNFDWQDELHDRFNISAHYFLQVGGRSEFDKNTHIGNTAFQQLIKRLNAKYRVGIHPSYKSNTHDHLVAQELQALEHVVGHNVFSSRQHFLMHEMPETYQRLSDIGIRQDHTLGYSTHLGFRAGIAAPFPFFDLTKNEATKLELVPFCCMDITPLHYMNQDPNEAVQTITKLMNKVEQVGGQFVSLWHNESLSEDGRWSGWRTVYGQMVEYASGLGTTKKSV